MYGSRRRGRGERGRRRKREGGGAVVVVVVWGEVTGEEKGKNGEGKREGGKGREEEGGEREEEGWWECSRLTQGRIRERGERIFTNE